MNAPIYPGWTGYPWHLRLLALLFVPMAVAECGGTLYFLWSILARSRTGDPGYQGWFLAIALCFWGLMALAVFALFPRLARSCWVLMYQYRCSETFLEVRDPVLQRRWGVRFDEVTRIRPFLLGGPRQAKAAFGWVLETASGGRIPACEALAIWPEIARRCSGAEFEPLPKDPLDQLRIRL